ncbi:hypothetical protein HOC13_00685 [Candidatus Woesearchaeota archaeon]|nr:hypothetical protein [Candidatus Woesearchaeota archaeon]
MKFKSLCVVIASLLTSVNANGCSECEYKGHVGKETVVRKNVANYLGDCGPEFWREVLVTHTDGSKTLFVDDTDKELNSLDYVFRKDATGKMLYENGSWEYECGIWGNGKEITPREQEQFEEYLAKTELK